MAIEKQAYRILLAEDEEHLLESMRLNLMLEGYKVQAVTNGLNAITAFREGRFNLVILDIMMPEMDGLMVCELIRLENPDVPIIFLTAKGSGQDRVMGLKKGADDYLTKPFNLEELLLRVEKLIRRGIASSSNTAPATIYEFGGNKINFRTYEAINYKGKSIKLTKKEALLLKLLIDRKPEVISRALILETVWGYDVFPSTRTIDNFILSFRKYFETDPRNPRHFLSIRGIGYQFLE